MKKIMVVGPTGSGKSSVCNYLEGVDKDLRKSQDTIYGKKTIDVPAAYIENHWMYQNVIAIAQNHARLLIMLVHNNTTEWTYSPQFAQVFTCPVLGVISHVPKGTRAQAMAVEDLRQAGVVSPYVEVEMNSGHGLIALEDAIWKKRFGGFSTCDILLKQS